MDTGEARDIRGWDGRQEPLIHLKIHQDRRSPYTNRFNQRQYFAGLHIGSNPYFPSFFLLFAQDFS